MSKRRRKKRKRSSNPNGLIAPFAAVVDAAVHLRDLLVQILEFIGLKKLPMDRSRSHSVVAEQKAAAKLARAARERSQRESVLRAREAKLMQSQTDEAEEFKKEVRRGVESVSRGKSVSHLARMQQRARKESRTAESTNAEAGQES